VWEEKPDCEVTFQKWLGAKNANNEIFAVINDGVYAGKADGDYLYLTLLRGSGYCVHPIEDRELYPQDRYLPRIDCGRYVYNLRLFKGNVFEVTKMAEEFNCQPYAINVFPTGTEDCVNLPTITIEGEVILTTVKTIESGEVVLRVYNPADNKQSFVINVGEYKYNGIANKREVVSIKYLSGKFIKMDAMTI
jgi:alpha-mannosidase